MKKITLTLLLFSTYIHCFSNPIIVTGGTKEVITYTAPANSKLQGIYILYGLDQAKLTYSSSTSNQLTWFSYTNNIKNKTILKNNEAITSTLDNLSNNTGYGIIDGADTICIWINDYKQYEPIALAVSPTNDSPCDEVNLTVSAPQFGLGYNDAIFPSSRHLLDFQLPITYKSMEYSEASSGYITKEMRVIVDNLTSNITITEPPLQNTIFTLGNDQFAAHWGLVHAISTPMYSAVSVQAKATYKKSDRDNANELEGNGPELKGSAPIEVLFTGFANTPTTQSFIWDVASDNKFNTKITSLPSEILRYTFSNAGTYYVRLSVSNSSASSIRCVDSLQVFTVTVSDSQLKVPNAFSPNGDGKNDEFLVTYKSIIKFNGWIFNRWGNELFRWSDPSKGWDGKVGGKYVTPGAYYYIIEAEGADGKQYNLKGSINVFSSK